MQQQGIQECDCLWENWFIAYLKVLRKAGFKYLKCYSSATVVAMLTKFSYILQLLSRSSTEQVVSRYAPHHFKAMLTVSHKLYNWWWQGVGGQGFMKKYQEGKGINQTKFMGYSGLKSESQLHSTGHYSSCTATTAKPG